MPVPSEQELAAALADYDGRTVDWLDLNDINCKPLGNSTSKFDCTWIGRLEAYRDVRWHAKMSRRTEGWQLTAAPRQEFVRVSVAQIDPAAMNGETVEILGWLDCPGGFDCSISDSRAEQVRSLTIDYVEAIERSLNRANGRRVLLDAIITDECAVNICTDRGPELVPVNIKVIR